MFRRAQPIHGTRASSLVRSVVSDSDAWLPIGSVRLSKSLSPNSIWEASQEWQVVPSFLRGGSGHGFNAALEHLLSQSDLESDAKYCVVHLLEAGRIQLQFKKSATKGSLRIYVAADVPNLPKATDHRTNLATKLLLDSVDYSEAAWSGDWSDSDASKSIQDMYMAGSGPDNINDNSLLGIFNSLPSPSPDPEKVEDNYWRETMHEILDGEVGGVKTELYHYQRRTVAMMLQREVEPSQSVSPFYNELKDMTDRPWYYSPLAGECVRFPPKFSSPIGGILCESMGTGKTLMALALVAATNHYPIAIPKYLKTNREGKVASLLDMAAATVARSRTHWKEYFEHQHVPKIVDAIKNNLAGYMVDLNEDRTGRRRSIRTEQSRKELVYLSTTTLFVVPANLVLQLQREIEKHTRDLNVLVLTTKSKDALPGAKELMKYDILLFSQERLAQESNDGKKIAELGPTGVPAAKWGRANPLPVAGSVIDAAKANDVDKAAIYRSSLRNIHFQRAFFDEGHKMGNAHRSFQNNLAKVTDMLRITSKWVISGTPTAGLFSLTESGEQVESVGPESSPITNNTLVKDALYEQEKKDLEKIGNIATVFLKAEPWHQSSAADRQRPDVPNNPWQTLVMQPYKHHHKQSLRNALETLIVRHRWEDIKYEVELPPLHKEVVRLDGCLQDRISLSVFAMAIIANKVTSEQSDEDYFFHPKNKKFLNELVKNLREASFFWLGTSAKEVLSTVKNSQGYLKDVEEKKRLDFGMCGELKEVVEFGNALINNEIWSCAATSQQLPVYLENPLPNDLRSKVALDGNGNTNPTLMSINSIHQMRWYLSNEKLSDDAVIGKWATSIQNFDVKETHRHATRSKKGKAAEAKKVKEQNENGEPVYKVIRKRDDRFGAAHIVAVASAKVAHLITSILKHYQTEKTIIFCDNESQIFYLTQALENFSITSLPYSTKLSGERSDNLCEFMKGDRIRVLLMDVAQAAYGLDITCATRTYFVSPILSKRVELQALRRCHRIGQTREVYAEILVLKDSIDEVIVQRSEESSDDAQRRCKNPQDDQWVSDWVKNVKMPQRVIERLKSPGIEQMAELSLPRPNLFDVGGLSQDMTRTSEVEGVVRNSDSCDQNSSESSSEPRMRDEHRKAQELLPANTNAELGGPETSHEKKRKRVGFAALSGSGAEEAEEDGGVTETSASKSEKACRRNHAYRTAICVRLGLWKPDLEDEPYYGSNPFMQRLTRHFIRTEVITLMYLKLRDERHESLLKQEYDLGLQPMDLDNGDPHEMQSKAVPQENDASVLKVQIRNYVYRTAYRRRLGIWAYQRFLRTVLDPSHNWGDARIDEGTRRGLRRGEDEPAFPTADGLPILPHPATGIPPPCRCAPGPAPLGHFAFGNPPWILSVEPTPDFLAAPRPQGVEWHHLPGGTTIVTRTILLPYNPNLNVDVIFHDMIAPYPDLIALVGDVDEGEVPWIPPSDSAFSPQLPRKRTRTNEDRTSPSTGSQGGPLRAPVPDPVSSSMTSGRSQFDFSGPSGLGPQTQASRWGTIGADLHQSDTMLDRIDTNVSGHWSTTSVTRNSRGLGRQTGGTLLTQDGIRERRLAHYGQTPSGSEEAQRPLPTEFDAPRRLAYLDELMNDDDSDEDFDFDDDDDDDDDERDAGCGNEGGNVSGGGGGRQRSATDVRMERLMDLDGEEFDRALAQMGLAEVSTSKFLPTQEGKGKENATDNRKGKEKTTEQFVAAENSDEDRAFGCLDLNRTPGRSTNSIPNPTSALTQMRDGNGENQDPSTIASAGSTTDPQVKEEDGDDDLYVASPRTFPSG